MLGIGDKVVYGRNGVMTIVDIREETALGVRKEYYVLSQSECGDGSLTFVPLDNPRLVKMMQPLMSKDELSELLKKAFAREPFEWIEDGRERNNRFKQIFESGNREDMLLLIRTARGYAEKSSKDGKKLGLSDEGIIKKTEKRIFSEIAAVFGCEPTDAERIVKGDFFK